jgi:hypothetical protein
MDLISSIIENYGADIKEMMMDIQTQATLVTVRFLFWVGTRTDLTVRTTGTGTGTFQLNLILDTVLMMLLILMNNNLYSHRYWCNNY